MIKLLTSEFLWKTCNVMSQRSEELLQEKLQRRQEDKEEEETKT